MIPEEEIVMQNPFHALPQGASLDEICGTAGRVFEERKARNRHTDFNTEIWYLAGDAMDRGFGALRGMTKEQVAREMGNSISRYLDVAVITIRGKEYPAKMISGEKYPVVRIKRTDTWYGPPQHPPEKTSHHVDDVVDCPYCGNEHRLPRNPWDARPFRVVMIGDNQLISCPTQGGLFYIQWPE